MSDDCKQDEAALPPVAGSALREHPQRGDHFPWHCPNCGEWETTQRVHTTWWENFWKGWGDFGAFECPRCSHRYPL